MQIGLIKGSVTATVKHSVFQGEKLLVVQPLHPSLKPKGKSLVAIDRVQAGRGDTVLYVDEGNSARTVLENDKAPVRSVIIGIVDKVDLY